MKIGRRTFISASVAGGLTTISATMFTNSGVFGRKPEGERLKRIQNSPNYRNGAFQNQSPTEVMRPEASYIGMMSDFINAPKSTTPPVALPSVATDLKGLPDQKPAIVWFGHSSYLIKHRGISLLIDPVFSGNASPVSFFAGAFAGADAYGVPDMPAIDMLVLTHDHYDHLDYKTVTRLIPKVKKYYVALGVGSHLESWGIPADRIIEFDWNETHTTPEGITLTAQPGRHFSGRGIKRAQTLWTSFVLQLPGYRLFLGGDSGYDSHFKSIGEKYGPFDLALLECGQYGVNWPFIHMKPEESVQAGLDLKALRVMPVHWAKFKLSLHPWNEPISRFTKEAVAKGLPYTTPLIGEPVIVGESYPAKVWWNL